MDFPQYRKLSNNKVYYKFLNEREFEEIQLVGSTAFSYLHQAEKYPEFLRNKDMLEYHFEGVEPSSEEEFTQLKLNYSL